MPEFTIIQGGGHGGPRGPGNQQLSYHLDRLTIEMLRGLARGRDNGRIVMHIAGIIESLNSNEGPINETVHAMLASSLDDGPDNPWQTPYTRELVRLSLMAAAEERCHDTAAAGRFGQRLRDLKEGVSLWVEEQEYLARSNGWSYLDRLKKTLR